MREAGEGGGEVNVIAGAESVGGNKVCVGICVNVADGSSVGGKVNVAAGVKEGALSCPEG